MINFIFFFLEFPRRCFSVTLYTQRFPGIPDYTNSTSDNCLLPNRTFTFNTVYNFTLNNCKLKKCYAIIDETSQMKWGNIGDINPSIFRTVNIEGANYLHKTAGIIFRPIQTTVLLNFQTQTCHDFYTLHPFENTDKLGEITEDFDMKKYSDRGLKLFLFPIEAKFVYNSQKVNILLKFNEPLEYYKKKNSQKIKNQSIS